MKTTNSEVANTIEDFIKGEASDWIWDDFISTPIEDAKLEKIRLQCAALPEIFPPNKPGFYCNDQGIAMIHGIWESVRD